MIEERRLERSKTQMTLGQLIERLRQLKRRDSLAIISIGYPHSYRGYYSDLAFERGGTKSVGKALEEAEDCLGRKFYGDYGDEYRMGEDTPLWVTERRHAALRLMSIADDGSLVTAEEDNE